MIIETNRLYLRKFVLEDASRMSEYRNKKEVAKYQSWHTYSVRRATRRIKELMRKEEFYLPHNDYHLAIVLKQTDEIIGDIFVDVINKTTFMLGYTLDSVYWGKGHASEMVGAFIDYMHKEHNFHKVMAYAYTSNEKSIRLLERLGFVQFDQSSFFGDVGYMKKIED